MVFCALIIGQSEIAQGTGRSFNQAVNWHHHLKFDAKSSHLSKVDAFRVNIDQVIDPWNVFQNIHKNLLCWDCVSQNHR